MQAEPTLCAGAEMPPLNDSSPEKSAAAPAQGGAFPAGGGLMKAVDDVAPDRSAAQVRATWFTAGCRISRTAQLAEYCCQVGAPEQP